MVLDIARFDGIRRIFRDHLVKVCQPVLATQTVLNLTNTQTDRNPKHLAITLTFNTHGCCLPVFLSLPLSIQGEKARSEGPSRKKRAAGRSTAVIKPHLD